MEYYNWTLFVMAACDSVIKDNMFHPSDFNIFTSGLVSSSSNIILRT